MRSFTIWATAWASSRQSPWLMNTVWAAGVDGGLLHLVHQGLQRGLPAPGLGDVDQVALVVHVEDRLDLEHGAQHGGGGRDAPSPLQEVQIVHGELVAQAELVGLGPVPDLFDGLPPGPLLGGQIDQQALAQRGAQGVHRVHLPVGVFLPQLVHGDDGGVVGGGQAGREGQDQHIPARLEQGLHRVHILGHVDGGGGGHLAGAQLLIEQVGVHLPIVRVIVVGVLIQDEAQREDLDVQLLDQFRSQIGGGISEDDEVGHNNHS